MMKEIRALGIDIEFNEACNASCVYCPVSINPRRKNKHMSLEDSDIAPAQFREL